jgi:hypothetical protein
VIRRQTDKIEVAPFPSWKTDDRLPQEKQARGQSREPGRFLPQRRQQRIKFLEMRSAPSRALRNFSTVLPYPLNSQVIRFAAPFTPGGNFLEAPDRFRSISLAGTMPTALTTLSYTPGGVNSRLLQT